MNRTTSVRDAVHEVNLDLREMAEGFGALCGASERAAASVGAVHPDLLKPACVLRAEMIVDSIQGLERALLAP